MDVDVDGIATGVLEVTDYRPVEEEEEVATRAGVMELVRQKDELEAELRRLQAVLAGEGVGLEEPLVDADGFPRADLDLHKVCAARGELRSKQADLISLVARIERGLHSLHSQARQTGGPAGPPPPHLPSLPFARVAVVVAGSPADRAGFRSDDLLSKFGTVVRENFSSLQNLSELAASSRDRALEVVVVRAGRPTRLRLVPTAWQGAGLIGFKLRPLAEEENPER